jgi:multiple sugar transport system permease protein
MYRAETLEQREPSYTDLSLPIKLLSVAILTVGAVVMLLPFAWMISTACKPSNELQRVPIQWIPENVSCSENIATLYEKSEDFNRYFLNTAIMTVGRTLGQLVLSALAAYGFARYKFPGRNVIFALCLGLLMVPFQAILIPEFILVRNLGWRNTFAGTIIPGAFSAFAMFLLRQAFLNIPVELEEAATLDGANPLQILWRIVLPLSAPALAAFAVITVQASWNDFLWPLVIANSPETRVITIGVSLLQSDRNTPFNLLMMGSLLATMPMLLMFLMLQRYFVQGVATSGLNR